MGRSGEYVGEVGFDGFSMGDRGRSRRSWVKSGEIGGVGGLGTSAGTGGRQKDFGAGGGVGRWGACVGEVGFDGLSMGDRGRSRRIYLVAVFSGVFAASALNADIGSPPDSVCAAYS